MTKKKKNLSINLEPITNHTKKSVDFVLHFEKDKKD